MINPNLSINKYFKEQVTKCMKATFGAMTQQHISKILSTTKKQCYNYLCFMRSEKNKGKFTKC